MDILKMKLTSTFIFFVSIIFILSSCQKETGNSTNSLANNTEIQTKEEPNTSTPTQETAFASLIPKQSFEINCTENYTATTAYGMKIEIPKGSLVDENGTVFTGKATLAIKEYYKASEIIMSGLPMHYNENGKTHHFQSDGMFTLDAKSGEKQLYIGDEQQIKLTTQRTKTGQGFAFYNLTNKGEWQEDKANTITPIETVASTKPLPKPRRPSSFQPVKFDPNFYTIEEDQRSYLPSENATNRTENTITQIDINVNENPWILDRSNWQFDNRSGYNWILRKIKKGKEVTHDTIEYNIRNAVRGNKAYTRLVAEYEQSKIQYKKDLEAYEDYLVRKANGQLTEAELTQELLITNFGTYNIDRYYSSPTNLVVERKYQLSSPIQTSTPRVYLIAKDNAGTLIPVDLSIYPNKIRYNKKEQNALIAVAGQKMYGLTQDQFEAAVANQLDEDQFDFTLEEIECNAADSFNETIEQLF